MQDCLVPPPKSNPLAVKESLMVSCWFKQGLAHSRSPSAALQEDHLTLPICCHMQVFSHPLEFLLMKDSLLWCQSLPIYLTALIWKSLHVCACQSSCSSYILETLTLLLHFFPHGSPLVRHGGNLPVQCKDKDSACMLVCGSLLPCRSDHIDYGERFWGTAGREKKADTFFLSVASPLRPSPFS